MSFHMIAYTLATGGSVTDADMTAATDPEISQRNNHYIFTEPYRLLASAAFGANISRLNFSVPSWNQITKVNVWPVNKSASIPSPPQIDQWDGYPLPIPQNEEWALKVTDSGNEQVTVFQWLAPMNWNRNLPPGLPPLPIFEARLNWTTPSLTANTWSGLGAVTFEQSFRGGTYAVVGAQIQGTNLMASRFVFPRAPIYQNRKLRPGLLAQASIGDLTAYNIPLGPLFWGEYGRFSTFEPFQMEHWANASGAIAVEMRIWVVWLSTDMNVVYTA